MPGCELDAWMPDYAMPERAVAPEEQIWSNIMDPGAAAKFLDQPCPSDLARPAGFEPATRCLEGRFAQRVSLSVRR